MLANDGDVNKAEHILIDVLNRSPNHTEALHFLSNVLGKLQRHQEVIYFSIMNKTYTNKK